MWPAARRPISPGLHIHAVFLAERRIRFASANVVDKILHDENLLFDKRLKSLNLSVSNPVNSFDQIRFRLKRLEAEHYASIVRLS
jgi:hypothetical protein